MPPPSPSDPPDSSSSAEVMAAFPYSRDEVMAAFPYSRSLARFLWEPLKSSDSCAEMLDTIEE